MAVWRVGVLKVSHHQAVWMEFKAGFSKPPVSDHTVAQVVASELLLILDSGDQRKLPCLPQEAAFIIAQHAVGLFQGYTACFTLLIT